MKMEDQVLSDDGKQKRDIGKSKYELSMVEYADITDTSFVLTCLPNTEEFLIPGRTFVLSSSSGSVVRALLRFATMKCLAPLTCVKLAVCKPKMIDC